MDFIAFEVYYYLSEQDKQIFLNSLDFAGRSRYQDLYDRWFYDSNNPITNPTTGIPVDLVSTTVNVNYCVGNSVNTVSTSKTFNRNDINAERLVIQSILSDYIKSNTPFTYAVNGPAPVLTCFTPVIDLVPIPPSPESLNVKRTVYGKYCENEQIQSKDILIEKTFPIGTSKNIISDYIDKEVSRFQSSLNTGKKTDVRVSLDTPPTDPVCKISKTTVLYASYCLGVNSKTSSKTIVYSSSDDLYIEKEKFSQEIAEKEETARFIKVSENSPPPNKCTEDVVNKKTTLYSAFCENGVAKTGFRDIEYSDTLDYNNKKDSYEKELNRVYKNVSVEEGKYPPGKNCTETTGTTGTSTKTIKIYSSYCEGGKPASSFKQIIYANEKELGDKINEYKAELLKIYGPGADVSPGTPATPYCGSLSKKLYAKYCDGSVQGSAEKIVFYKNEEELAVEFKKYFDELDAIHGKVIVDYVIPTNLNCLNVTSGVTAVQIQFYENDVLVTNASSVPRPSVSINGKGIPPSTDSRLPTFVSNASYFYKINTADYYIRPGTFTINFSAISGWDTPSPYTVFVNSESDNVPGGGPEPGLGQAGSYVYVRYNKRSGGTGPSGPGPGGPGPDGPGPDGPGPDGPGPDGPGPIPPPPTTTTFRPPTTTTTFRPTTTTLRVPETYWLKRINPVDNRRYIFDVTEGLFSNNIRNLTTFFTGSTSENYSRYYTHVYDENPKTSLTSSIQFSIAYGHSGGSGSLDEGNKINITPTRAIYSQYRNLVLGKSNIKFNLTGRETDSIYVINYQSKRLKDRLDAGVIELNIAHLSGSQFLAGGGTISTHTGSNVKLAGNNRVLRLIDDSKISTSPDYTDVGYSYNIVSGTLETGVYNQTAPHYYGKLIPSLGVVILDGNKLDLSASFATSKASEIEGYNAIKLYKSFSGSALVQDNSGDYLGMKARRVIREYNDYYFIRVLNNEYNFTNNLSRIKSEVPDFMVYKDADSGNPHWKTNLGLPLIPLPVDPTSLQGLEDIRRRTLLKLENGEITEPFANNSQVYITTVGLYNAQRELIAVGKLPKPILKNFTEESIFTVKLKY